MKRPRLQRREYHPAGGRAIRTAVLTAIFLRLGSAPGLFAQYRQVVVEPDPNAPLVSIVIRYSTGSADDPRGLEGTAFLLGRVLELQAGRALVGRGARAQVEVVRRELIVSLLADPIEWREGLARVESVLYREGLSPDLIETARSEVLDILRFEAGAPVREFEDERAIFLLGESDPAARPIQGTETTLGAVSDADLSGFRSEHIRSEDAVVAATGPVVIEELGGMLSSQAREVVSQPVEQASTALPVASGAPSSNDPVRPPVLRLYRTTPTALEVPPEPTGPPAWTTGERRLVDRELTSTWISVAFPFPRGTPDLLLAFLGHLILEELTPTPPDPGLYEAGVEQLRLRDSPVVVVTASVDPRVAAEWEERLSRAFRELAEAPPAGAFFELARRRFRSELLLELALPERRARWLARRTATATDTSIDLTTGVWSLRRTEVGGAAAAAGPSRTILMGPLQMMDR